MKLTRTKFYIFLALEIALCCMHPAMMLIPIGFLFIWALVKAINEGTPQ